MSVVYFTSNASTGAGSLVETIANAQPGDVILPDESVFERGSIIEIALVSTLTIDKTLTLDGGPYRVRLNGGGAVVCANVESGVSVTFTGYEFVSSSGAGVVANGPTTFERCVVAGSNGAGIAASGASVTLSDSVVCGNNGAAFIAESAAISGSTLAGNVGFTSGTVAASNSILLQFSGAMTEDGNVVNVASSQIGFVASPPDDLSAETWTDNAWQNWDLRLLDDKSPNPSPFRNSGDVGKMSRYDVEGNFRGRTADGASVCSPGAYETIQADLFWIGGEFTQEQIDAAPKNVVFSNLKRGYNAAIGTQFSGTIEWTLPTPGTRINVQSSVNDAPWRVLSNLSGNSESRSASGIPVGTTIYRFQVVLGSGVESAWSYIELNFDESLQTGDVAPFSSGIETELSPNFGASAGWATSRFAKTSGAVAPNDVTSAFIDVGGSTSDVLKTPSLGIEIGGGRKLVLATNSADTSANGVNATQCAQTTLGVGAEISTAAVSGYFSAPKVRLASNARFDAILRYSSSTGVDLWSESNAWIRSAIYPAGLVWPSVFYESLSVARTSGGVGGLDGAYNCGTFSRAKGTDASGYVIGVAPGTSIRCQHFECGVAFVYGEFFSNQVDVKLHGDATAIETRSGSATYDASGDFIVDVSETTSATLTLGGQTVYGDAPTSSVALAGSAKIDERGLVVALLTLAADATLMLVGDASVVLASISVASAVVAGNGAFFAPAPAPVGLTLENGAIWCDVSAGVTSIDVDPLNATTVKFTVVKTNDELNIVAQYSTDDGLNWDPVETEAGSNVYELEVPQGSNVTVRVATFSGWLSDTVSTAPLLPVWTVSNAFESFLGVSNVFEVATGGSNDGLNTYDFNGYGYL